MTSPTPTALWNNRALLRLLWPLIVEQILAVSVGLIDTMMVTTVGEAAVSGVSLVDSINILIVTLFTSLSTGGAVVCSQYIGRKNPQKASLAASQLVYSVFALSVIFALFTFLLRSTLLQLIYGHISADVMLNAETYFSLSAFSYPAIALYGAGVALLRSMGNSKAGMAIAFMINLLNIGGNSFFIFYLNMGVAGAALATLISRTLAAVAAIALLMRRSSGPISLRGLLPIRIELGMARRILRIGIPTGLESSMFQIGKLLVARILSTFGTAAIAGNAIAISLCTFATLPGMAFGLAILTVVGQCIGAGLPNEAIVNTKKLMRAGRALVGVISLVVLLVHRPLLGLFNLSPEATELASNLLFIFLITAPLFWPQSFILPSALRGAGDARFPMVVSLASMWIMRIGMAYLLAYGYGLGAMGVWIAMITDWVVRGICFYIRWHRKRWLQRAVID